MFQKGEVAKQPSFGANVGLSVYVVWGVRVIPFSPGTSQNFEHVLCTITISPINNPARERELMPT